MKRGRYLRGIVLIIAVLLYTHNIFAWWNTEIINFDISSTYPGINLGYSKPAIAIGDDSIIHVTYVDWSESNLVYSYKEKQKWHTEIVDPNIADRIQPSIALDSNNNPHISYGNKYAHRDIEWHVEIAHIAYTAADEEASSLIALDSRDTPHIISCSYHITYSYKDNSGWIWEVLESDGRMPSAIAFDTNDNLHLAYAGTFPEEGLCVKYAYKDSAGWHIEIVDNNVDRIRQVIFALDSSGNPHICYNSISQLKYAHKDSTGWHIEVLEEGNVNDLTLALATNDNPHVLYSVQDSPTRIILKYAYKDSATWNAEVVLNYLSRQPLGPANSMILDLNNNPHVTYCSNWWYPGKLGPFIGVSYDGGILKYADKVDSEWKTHVLDEGLSMQAAYFFNIPDGTPLFTIKDKWDGNPVMAIDGLGNPHIFFRDGYCWNIGWELGYRGVTTLKHAF